MYHSPSPATAVVIQCSFPSAAVAASSRSSRGSLGCHCMRAGSSPQAAPAEPQAQCKSEVSRQVECCSEGRWAGAGCLFAAYEGKLGACCGLSGPCGKHQASALATMGCGAKGHSLLHVQSSTGSYLPAFLNQEQGVCNRPDRDPRVRERRHACMQVAIAQRCKGLPMRPDSRPCLVQRPSTSTAHPTHTAHG